MGIQTASYGASSRFGELWNLEPIVVGLGLNPRWNIYGVDGNSWNK